MKKRTICALVAGLLTVSTVAFTAKNIIENRFKPGPKESYIAFFYPERGLHGTFSETYTPGATHVYKRHYVPKYSLFKRQGWHDWYSEKYEILGKNEDGSLNLKYLGGWGREIPIKWK